MENLLLINSIPNLPHNLRQLLDNALTMAKKAGEIHLKYFRSPNLPQKTKQNDSDVVTIADKESENTIIAFIKQHHPDHGIIAEEAGKTNSNNTWRWVIDPLDGTTNFAAGLPTFCVSIALEQNQQAIIGVVLAPYLNECFYAVKNFGAYLNGKQIHCSTKTQLSKAVLATGVPYDRNQNPDNNLAEITHMALNVRAIRRMGSAAIDLCYTAAGFFDAYWELNLNRWDVAAGQLIATEAGAIIEPIRQNRNHSILAAAPSIINPVREILKQ